MLIILFRLIDTAGIREHTSDVIESIGVEKSLEKMRQADVVLYLLDVQDDNMEGIIAQLALFKQINVNYLIVVNKIDITGEDIAREKFSGPDKIIFISAKNQHHIEVLKERLVDLVLQGNVQAENKKTSVLP